MRRWHTTSHWRLAKADNSCSRFKLQSSRLANFPNLLLLIAVQSVRSLFSRRIAGVIRCTTALPPALFVFSRWHTRSASRFTGFNVNNSYRSRPKGRCSWPPKTLPRFGCPPRFALRRQLNSGVGHHIDPTGYRHTMYVWLYLNGTRVKRELTPESTGCLSRRQSPCSMMNTRANSSTTATLKPKSGSSCLG